MGLTPEDKLNLEIDTAWQAFCDGEVAAGINPADIGDPQLLALLETVFKAGYAMGCQVTIRQIREGQLKL